MRRNELPLLSLPNKVVFPYQVIRLRMSESSYSFHVKNNTFCLITLIDETITTNSDYLLDNNKLEETGFAPINDNAKPIFSEYGTIIKIISEDRIFVVSGGSEKVLRNIKGIGIARFRIKTWKQQKSNTNDKSINIADIELLKEDLTLEKENELKQKGIISMMKEQAIQYINLEESRSDIAERKKEIIKEETNTLRLTYNISNELNISVKEKLELLKINIGEQLINEVINHLTKIIDNLKISKDINEKLRNNLSKEKRNLYLRQKLEAINNELYGTPVDEKLEIEQKLSGLQLPEETMKVAMQELRRLKSIQPHQQEYNIVLNYLTTICDLPWNQFSVETNDIVKAEQVLNRDHAGLEKVKKRIVEFLAVRQLKNNNKGSIICLQGPPGVGKTSLGKSIAEALGRKFARIALGGVRDEAEIRGHRRTYIGSMPGTIIQTLLRVKVANPVILLDEIDKISRDFKGDPSSALLEVLDPAQNSQFKDHFLNVPFDLSNVLFIATANTIETIQPPLLDRLEVISLTGYTLQEKLEIASKYLLSKQIEENGITKEILDIPESTLTLVINNYSREAGVRELERTIGTLCRKVAFMYSKHLSENQNKTFEKVNITSELCQEFLGPEIYENDILERLVQPGIAIGLAWTSVGGRVLLVEVSMSKGIGKLELTGKVGDTMKESVMTALGWIKSNYHRIKIDQKAIEQQLDTKTQNLDDTTKQSLDRENDQNDNLFNKIDLHIHFPAAAIPKDGPSAGVTIVTAIISLLTGRIVRTDVAMTGEITLKGLVLPVGGIKEKSLAAHSIGLKRVILPARCKKDLDDISKEIRDQIEFIFVSKIEDVLNFALGEKVIELGEDKEYKGVEDGNTINKLSKL